MQMKVRGPVIIEHRVEQPGPVVDAPVLPKLEVVVTSAVVVVSVVVACTVVVAATSTCVSSTSCR